MLEKTPLGCTTPAQQETRQWCNTSPTANTGPTDSKVPTWHSEQMKMALLRLSKATPNGGAVIQTWNIWNIDPCKD